MREREREKDRKLYTKATHLSKKNHTTKIFMCGLWGSQKIKKNKVLFSKQVFFVPPS